MFITVVLKNVMFSKRTVIMSDFYFYYLLVMILGRFLIPNFTIEVRPR